MSGDSSAMPSEDSDQYKRKCSQCSRKVSLSGVDLLGMSVKERARMLTTHIPPTGSTDKKAGTPSSTSSGKSPIGIVHFVDRFDFQVFKKRLNTLFFK